MDRITQLRIAASPSPHIFGAPCPNLKNISELKDADNRRHKLGAACPNPNNISEYNDAENCRLDMRQTKNLLEYIATDPIIKNCEELKYWATLIADFITFWQRECGTAIHPLLNSVVRGNGRLVTLASVLNLVPDDYQDYIFIEYERGDFFYAEDVEFLREVSKKVQLEAAKRRERRMMNGGEGEWV